MKTKLLFLFVNVTFTLFIAVAFTSIAFGQEAEDDSLKLYNIKEVVITGSRSTMDKDKVPQKIETISSYDIALTPYQEFTDILKRNSSVDVIQYPGLLSGVGIRGFRPETGGLNQRTLLLVDGRPAGTSNLATINPQNIERVEILKGPASALYGSQAMGGVVNVITKKSEGTLRSSLYAEFGSYETLNLGASTGGNVTKRLDFDLSFQSFNRNENYKLGTDNLLRGLLDGDEYTVYSEDQPPTTAKDGRGDGNRREYTRLNYHTGSVRLGYKFSDNWRVDIDGEKFVARNVGAPSDLFFDNGKPSTKDIERENGSVSIEGTINKHQLFLRGYTANEATGNNTLTTYKGESIPPYLSFQRSSSWKGLQIKDVIALGSHGITLGIDHNIASTESRAFNQDGGEKAPYSPNYTLTSTGIYAQGQLKFLHERLIITPGARFDNITYEVEKTPLLDRYVPGEESNPFFSPNLGFQYQIVDFLNVHATIGKAFVTPDAYNVAGYSVSISNKKAAITEGNPNLENENSITWDAGLRFQDIAKGFTADVTYFSTEVNDRITKSTTNPTSLEFTSDGDTIASRSTYINADKANISGLELELGYDFGALHNYTYSLRVFANATKIIEAEEITVDESHETKRDIHNVSNFNSTFGLDYNNFKWLNARLSGRYVGNRKDTDYNDPQYPEIEYPAFMVLDFMVALTYEKQHTLSLSIDNLTDENYYEKRGYNMPGRTVSIRYGLTF